jgi:hypothetical protein
MKRSLMILSMMVLLTNCTSRFEFDGFDPTTATVRWIIKKNYDVKRTSVHTKPSASPCTATFEAVSNRGGVEPLPLCKYVHGKHGG